MFRCEKLEVALTAAPGAKHHRLVARGHVDGEWSHRRRRTEIGIKKYTTVEKIPSGSIVRAACCHVKQGRALHVHRDAPLLLDCLLEYKKIENQINVEIVGDQDKIEKAEHMAKVCANVIDLKPNIVFTEKEVSALAQHFLLKAEITAIRRLRKTDNNQLARRRWCLRRHRTAKLSKFAEMQRSTRASWLSK
ncbi:hypothetical protein pipiens_008192 [Culex pipiens pipiens]|uniref:Uncharacterized protein n=1 Tax=Culex pipiens pipiens TaxID=38569 RepID=A0ABD1DIT8_CULPP